MPGTVGVAPGTITLQLDGPPCPPDNIWPYMTPPEWGSVRPSAAAGPQVAVPIVYDAYGTDSKLLGLGTLPQINPLGTRWDIIAMVGGGVLLAGLLIGVVAAR